MDTPPLPDSQLPTRPNAVRAGMNSDLHDPLADAFPAAAAWEIPKSLGVALGHYDIQEVLGRGGFGVVVKAFDRKLQRTVAIKMMNEELAATSPARKRFLREARAGAAVRHENVVQIYTVEEEPLPHLVMEYIPGGSLQQRIDSTGPLDVIDILKIGAQIARGLAAAHEMKLVHRDIKPANILLKDGSDTPVRITDFGLARAADDASLTQSGLVAGTPMFMAPEQACAEAFDHRADLFSLGSVLYVMASGRPPFRAPTSVAVLKRVVEDTPRPIREIIPEVPEWLCAIIGKLHEKNPDRRYATAREVADVFGDCLLQYQAFRTLKDFSKIPGHEPKAAKPRRGLYAVAAIAVLGIGVMLWMANQTKPPAGGTAAIEPVVADPHRFVNAMGMEFRRVPAGKAWLGGGGGRLGDEEFELPEDVFLGTFEVTQGEWNTLMDFNPSRFRRDGDGDDEVQHLSDEEIAKLPVDSVSWVDCQQFLEKLNAAYPEPGWTYRLPTQPEWEYACRGGPMGNRELSAFDFYFVAPTNKPTTAQLSFKSREPRRTVRVGSFPPNPLGLHDMHGNVIEIMQVLEGENNPDPHCSIRGGTWHDPLDFCKASRTNGLSSKAHLDGAGLRVIRVRTK